MQHILISVVICTYNRSVLLKGCLESLEKQTIDKSNYEIIVVDNNSRDNTRQIVETFIDKCSVRYCLETEIGLSHARNRGVREANGNYIAFIDDDAMAAPNWLTVAYQLIKTLSIELDCLGGPILPFYTSPKPDWFKDEYEIRRDWDTPRYLSSGQSFSGSNSIWTKSALLLIRGFDVDAGVKGNQLDVGEETTAFRNLWKLKENPRLYFSPELIVYHWVPSFKMTVRYRLKRHFVMGLYLSKSFRNISIRKRMLRISLIVFDLAKLIIRGFIKRKSGTRWQNWVYEMWASPVMKIGELVGLLGIYPIISQK